MSFSITLPLYSYILLTVLLESNVVGDLTEALAANVDFVLADQSVTVTAHAALRGEVRREHNNAKEE